MFANQDDHVIAEPKGDDFGVEAVLSVLEILDLKPKVCDEKRKRRQRDGNFYTRSSTQL